MSEDKSFLKRLLTETWPARMAQDALKALMLPGDVYQGKVSMYGDDGRTNPEIINRAADLAGLVTLGAGVVPAEANSLRSGVSNKVAKSEYPIDEITKKAIDDYNRMLPSEKDQYSKWAGEEYGYDRLGRKEAEDMFGDEIPHDLSKIFSSGDDAVMITTRGENVKYVPSKSAQPYDEFIRDVVHDEGGITKAASLDDIYNNLGKKVEAGYPAASEAAKRIAKEMGWDVTSGVRYFDISKGDVSKHVRVSDHGQLTRSNPNARTPDINLAPGAHDYNDYIDILKKYGLAGASASPLAALMASQSQGELQQ